MASNVRFLAVLASKSVLEEMGRRSTMLLCCGAVSKWKPSQVRGWWGKLSPLLTSSTAILEPSDILEEVEQIIIQCKTQLLNSQNRSAVTG